jgi:hypothetical protein
VKIQTGGWYYSFSYLRSWKVNDKVLFEIWHHETDNADSWKLQFRRCASRCMLCRRNFMCGYVFKLFILGHIVSALNIDTIIYLKMKGYSSDAMKRSSWMRSMQTKMTGFDIIFLKIKGKRKSAFKQEKRRYLF